MMCAPRTKSIASLLLAMHPSPMPPQNLCVMRLRSRKCLKHLILCGASVQDKKTCDISDVAQGFFVCDVSTLDKIIERAHPRRPF